MIPVLQKLEQDLQSTPQNQSEQNETGYGSNMLLCGLMQVILAKIGHKLQEDMINKIIKLFTDMFMKENRVAEHVLIAFQGMATSSVGAKISLENMGRFLKAGLQETSDVESTKIACGILSDLS